MKFAVFISHDKCCDMALVCQHLKKDEEFDNYSKSNNDDIDNICK